ncbi:MAG: shikimate kinase [Janthinobacterium lividum]
MSSLSRLPTQLKRIILTGFMGSGKTTVGRLLAAQLGWAFADLDECVEAQQGMTVPRIFAERGEAAFRIAETTALADLLAQSNLVLALGGGAIVSPANRDLLHGVQATAIVHLDAPFAVLYERCTVQALDPGATARPLLGERSAAEARYQQRRELYADVAHQQAEANASPAQVVEKIMDFLAPALEFKR